MNRHEVLKLPIGYDNFGQIIENQVCFIDKTLFIRDILDDRGYQVILITRPRRFGKTINLSMLQHFFASEINGQETATLFKHLKIMQQGETYTKHQGQYPVIFVSFKEISADTYKNAYDAFAQLMANLYTEHEYLLSSPTLLLHQKNKFQSILDEKASKSALRTAIRDLTTYLHKHHGKRPWIFIDEYDTPVHTAYRHGYYKKMIDFMRAVLGSALKTNASLERAVITGVLRISQESLFSELNNLVEATLLNHEYAEHFGFTEIEVNDLFKKANLPLVLDDVRAWYNGYQMDNTTLYNPWSIVQCVRNQGELKSYWVNTSNNTLIHNLIAQQNSVFYKDLQRLLAGQSIEAAINEHIVFVYLKDKPENIWSLLFMSGYLKIISKNVNGVRPRCVLAVPNQEILSFYQDLVESWLELNIVTPQELVNDLLTGKLEIFEEQLVQLIGQTSFLDMARFPEAFYQGFLLGLTASISPKHYLVSSNNESGDGFYDVFIQPYDKQKMAIILELKSIKSNDPKKLLIAAKNAIQQIRHKNYAQKAINAGCTNIVLLGLAFHGKTVKVVHEMLVEIDRLT